MREVVQTRFVDATPAELERALSPSTVLEAAGTFTVVETEAVDDGQRVTARGGGMEAVFEFEDRTDGLRYRQVGQQGPFEAMETTVTYTARDHGSEVTVRSSVSLGLPLASLTDRVAAWKRRGELDRMLDGLAEHVS
ncbi:SRPBCC family protein [Halomicroarcula sp. F13]|uniref:SRPBCC family protein n=1 Tax=Haloarcula rubra TaxID=2487747 RepID=A0AAW4PNB2_9EURY|nr:SRPBCC family protein [Halomicroarcula rubra]MBX0321882.1 SRPBCC family protein [Halomicroarcula rubra]